MIQADGEFLDTSGVNLSMTLPRRSTSPALWSCLISACSITSSRESTGITSTMSTYLSSSNTSCILAQGITTVLTPAAAAASILAVTPPIGSTSPLTDNEPVIAKSCRIGISSKAEITAVAMVIDAESPSTP